MPFKIHMLLTFWTNCCMQVLESASQRHREEGAAERHQHADKVAELTGCLQACEDNRKCLQIELELARKAGVQNSKQHAHAVEELLKLKDQLQTCLEYRKKCKHQLTEIQDLRQRLADMEAGGQHAAQQGQRAEQDLDSTQAMARSQNSAISRKKHWPVGYLSLAPARSVPTTGSGSRRQEAMPGPAPGRDNEAARLLQRVQEAEGRAENEAQMRLKERESFKAMHQRKLQRMQQEYDELKAKYDAKKRQTAHIWGPSQVSWRALFTLLLAIYGQCCLGPEKISHPPMTISCEHHTARRGRLDLSQ